MTGTIHDLPVELLSYIFALGCREVPHPDIRLFSQPRMQHPFAKQASAISRLWASLTEGRFYYAYLSLHATYASQEDFIRIVSSYNHTLRSSYGCDLHLYWLVDAVDFADGEQSDYLRLFLHAMNMFLPYQRQVRNLRASLFRPEVLVHFMSILSQMDGTSDFAWELECGSNYLNSISNPQSEVLDYSVYDCMPLHLTSGSHITNFVTMRGLFAGQHITQLLTSLHISSSRLLSKELLWKLLEMAPALTKLTLYHVYLDARAIATDDLSIHPIVLPSLRSLKITYSFVETAYTILSELSLPRVWKIWIGADGEGAMPALQINPVPSPASLTKAVFAPRTTRELPIVFSLDGWPVSHLKMKQNVDSDFPDGFSFSCVMTSDKELKHIWYLQVEDLTAEVALEFLTEYKTRHSKTLGLNLQNSLVKISAFESEISAVIDATSSRKTGKVEPEVSNIDMDQQAEPNKARRQIAARISVFDTT